MNKENTTLGTASILNPNFDATYCQYRLPCGYCEKLGRDCPKSITYNPLGPIFTATSTSIDDSIYDNNFDKEKK